MVKSMIVLMTLLKDGKCSKLLIYNKKILLLIKQNKNFSSQKEKPSALQMVFQYHLIAPNYSIHPQLYIHFIKIK